MKILRVIQIGLLPAAIVLESVLILASRNRSRSDFLLELLTMFVFRSGLLSTLVYCHKRDASVTRETLVRYSLVSRIPGAFCLLPIRYSTISESVRVVGNKPLAGPWWYSGLNGIPQGAYPLERTEGLSAVGRRIKESQ